MSAVKNATGRAQPRLDMSGENVIAPAPSEMAAAAKAPPKTMVPPCFIGSPATSPVEMAIFSALD
jgi:hypothetical protein